MSSPSQFDPRDFDYGLHYRVFHDESPAHIAGMTNYHRKQIQAHLPEPCDDPVLDIGCGMGFAMRSLVEAGFPRAMGIDIDSGQIATCLRHGLNVELVKDSIAYLQDRPNTFALITMLDVFEHVPIVNQVPMMRAVFNSLLPGGRVIVQVPNANSALASRWRYIDYTHTISFTEHSLGFVFRASGFDQFDIPGDGLLGRPPVKLWTRIARQGLRRWLIRWLWRQIVAAHLDGADIRKVPLGLNMIGVAFKPGIDNT